MELLEFIKSCFLSGNVLWTHHINMRLKERFIARKTILDSVASFEIIESYPDDKYLPSHLVRAEGDNEVFHIHIAVDSENEKVIIVTAYRPAADQWGNGYRVRRRS